MQTLKTALVVVALLAVLFVAYQALTQGQIELPIQFGAMSGAAPQDPAAPEPASIAVEAPPLSPWDATAELTPSPAPADVLPNVAASISSESSLAATPPGNAHPPSRDAASSMPDPPSHLTTGSDADTPGAVAPAGAVEEVAPADSVRGGASLTTPLREPETSDPSAAAEEGPSRYSSPAAALYAFEQARHKAEGHIADGKLALALLTLSVFYQHPDLDAATHKQLNERLDQLAGTVIYSTRHLLEPPHKAMRGETLTAIAARYNAPLTLLQNINGIRDPELLVAGTELKVLRGPLRAEIDVDRSELTLFLGGLYAGRFPVQAGDDPAPKAGQYDVLDIQPGRAYYSAAGQSVPAGNPANPYGSWWIDLGGGMSLHGSPEAGSGETAGCLSLAPRDAADVAAILSIGSKVVIR
ncbi:MAG: LysM peptidoglycan-binding domain-containing protein [Planctomycetes bacterium]|nr:LysM peptidoglycan-binding domain-containing protein [Planctomycetota bacterium]